MLSIRRLFVEKLAAQESHHDLVHVPSLDEGVLALPSLDLEADACVETVAALVDSVGRERDPVQVELVEGAAAEEADRLGPETFAPVVLAADHEAEHRVA